MFVSVLRNPLSGVNRNLRGLHATYLRVPAVAAPVSLLAWLELPWLQQLLSAGNRHHCISACKGVAAQDRAAL